MKKVKNKKLNLNKKSITNLNGIKGGNVQASKPAITCICQTMITCPKDDI